MIKFPFRRKKAENLGVNTSNNVAILNLFTTNKMHQMTPTAFYPFVQLLGLMVTEVTESLSSNIKLKPCVCYLYGL